MKIIQLVCPQHKKQTNVVVSYIVVIEAASKHSHGMLRVNSIVDGWHLFFMMGSQQSQIAT